MHAVTAPVYAYVQLPSLSSEKVTFKSSTTAGAHNLSTQPNLKFT